VYSCHLCQTHHQIRTITTWLELTSMIGGKCDHVLALRTMIPRLGSTHTPLSSFKHAQCTNSLCGGVVLCGFEFFVLRQIVYAVTKMGHPDDMK